MGHFMEELEGFEALLDRKDGGRGCGQIPGVWGGMPGGF